MRVLLKRPLFTPLGRFRPGGNAEDGTTTMPDSLRPFLPKDAEIIEDTEAHKLADARRRGMVGRGQSLKDFDPGREAAAQMQKAHEEAERVLAERKKQAAQAEVDPPAEQAEDEPVDEAEQERLRRAAEFKAQLEAETKGPRSRSRSKTKE